jgi:membrane protease YdiL (CAAX protease family)
MDEMQSPAPLSDPPPPEIFSAPPRSNIFFSANGPRVWVRLLLFFAIIAAVFFAAGGLARLLNHGKMPVRAFSLQLLLVSEAVSFGAFLIASYVMARIEKRSLADYGLPWRFAFQARFWQGIVMGFACISLLMGAMHLAGVFQFGSVALHGGELWKYGALWGLAFLLVGFFEEFGFRGYVLFTLGTGIGFWPSALLLSLLFGYVHHSNSGENWLGAFSAGFIGFVFCIMLQRTGNLWLPIGFHTAWDWGETFFYGVPDSGQVAPGHFLNSSLSGPAWLSGGTVGPEASWLCLILVCLLGIFIAVFVGPAKSAPRNVSMETPVPLDASEGM